MRPTADYWIQKLQLTAHIEGGAYNELYRSPLTVPADILPDSFHGDRHICTGIYFLLQQGQFSAFHKIAADEQWHFYYGDPLIVYEIEPGGRLLQHHLGPGIDEGQTFHCTVTAGNWFASRVAPGSAYTLVGCTVSPGFDFADFELAHRHQLIEKYPQHSGLITELTRQ